MPPFSRAARREIARFRGLSTAETKKEARQPVPVEDLIHILFEEHHINQPGFQQTLMENWKQVVGPGNSHRCSPLRIIEPNTLVIAAPNPTFRQELSFQKPYLLKAIRNLPGGNKIKDLRFIAG